MDLAVAAASAAGETVVLPPKRRPRAVTPPDDDDLLQYDEAEDLPDVDDLEVAAAAAAAAQAALQRAADAPLYKVPQRVLAAPPDDDERMDEDEEDEEDDGDEEGVVVALEIVDKDGCPAVKVHLLPLEAGSQLKGNGHHSATPSSDEEGDEIGGPEDLRAMINALEAEDEAGDDGGERGADALGLPAPAPFDLDIAPDEPISAAGKIASLVEGMIIVQTTEGCRTLAEGSVLCLDDRTPLGRVEDVFGPVKSPFYALRYYAGDGLPASVAPGSAVFSVDRYADMLVPDKLKAKGYDAADADPADPAETKFSDDEEEAEYLRREAEAVKERAQQMATQLAPARGNRSGRGRGGRGRGRGPGRGGRGGGPGQHMPYGGGYGMPQAGAPWPYGPYGHYPLPYAVGAQYAATGYAPGGAPLAGWGAPPPATGAPPGAWPQQPPPGWGGQ